MRAIYVFLLIPLLGGATCNTKPLPPPQPGPAADLAVPTTYAACVGLTSLPIASDVCYGLFTKEGYSCVQCAGVSGCMDTIDVMYCVRGSCTQDPACAPPPTARRPGAK